MGGCFVQADALQVHDAQAGGSMKISSALSHATDDVVIIHVMMRMVEKRRMQSGCAGS